MWVFDLITYKWTEIGINLSLSFHTLTPIFDIDRKIDIMMP